MATPKKTTENPENNKDKTNQKNRFPGREENPNRPRIQDDEDEDQNEEIDDPTRQYRRDNPKGTGDPGTLNPNREKNDPEINPQRIDPNETEENPGRQRERERNPNQ